MRLTSGLLVTKVKESASIPFRIVWSYRVNWKWIFGAALHKNVLDILYIALNIVDIWYVNVVSLWFGIVQVTYDDIGRIRQSIAKI